MAAKKRKAKGGKKRLAKAEAEAKPAELPESVASRARAPMVEVSPEILDEVFEALAEGETLTAWCKGENRPRRQSIVRVINAGGRELQERFNTARSLGFDAIAERTRELLKEDLPKGKDGRVDPGLVAQRKAIVDNDMRLLAKWDTARYGDKLQVDGGGVNIIIAPPVVRSRDAEFEVVEDEPRRLNGNGHGRLGDG